jgi:hypothetical protein
MEAFNEEGDGLEGVDDALLQLLDLDLQMFGGVETHLSGRAQEKNPAPAKAPAPKRATPTGSETYERKKGRAKMLRQEISDKFDELHALLLETAPGAETAFIKDKPAKRQSVLDSAIQVIKLLVAQLAALGVDLHSTGPGSAAAAASAPVLVPPVAIQYPFRPTASLPLPMPAASAYAMPSAAAAATQGASSFTCISCLCFYCHV